MTKRFGFTLAEVLITLGIIGVVAAMTIPTLIANTTGAQFKSAFKKSLSTLSQAVLMNVGVSDYDFSVLKAETGADASIDGSVPRTMSEILRNRMQSATAYKYTEDSGNGKTDISSAQPTGSDYTFATFDELLIGDAAADAVHAFQFGDNTAFAYLSASHDCTAAAPCLGIIDVNGSRGPNVETTCTAGTLGFVYPIGHANNANSADACAVAAGQIRDIFPVFFYDQTVVPATNAGMAVLHDVTEMAAAEAGGAEAGGAEAGGN